MWGIDDLEFFSRYDGLLYFRINALGSFCLEQTRGYERSKQTVGEKRLKVLSTLEVAFRPESLPKGDLLFLERFSDFVSEGVVKLSRSKILDSVSQGTEFKRIVEFLERSSETPIPETVSRFLRDLERKSTCLTDAGHARLLKVTDPELACLLANDPELKKFCLPAGREHLAIWPGKEKVFAATLKKIGYSFPAFLENV